MLKNNLKPKPNLLAVSIAAALTLPAGYIVPAFAQDDESLEQILVTGSRIVRRDFEANSPIMTIESEFFDETSDVGIENSLNRLPQFIPAATQFETQGYEPTATDTPGVSTLSLRGLGSNRNLILLDGNRMMPVNAAMTIDINSIPSAMIQRVETITGGASSVYGADAVAGVVNFILKKDFEGADIDVQYGETFEGDGGSTRISGIVGANFADGRGNVVFGAGLTKRSEVYARDRKFFREGWDDPTVPAEELFYVDTSIAWGANDPSQAAMDSLFPDATGDGVDRGARLFLNRADYETVYSGGSWFNGGDPDGTYRYLDGFERFAGAEGTVDGTTFRNIGTKGLIDENQTYQLLSVPLEQYSMFGRGSYDFTDNISGWVQGTFSQTETTTKWQATPMIGTNWGVQIPHGSNIWDDSLQSDGVTTSLDYLPGGRYDLNCAPIGGCTESEAFPVPAEYGMLLDSRDDPNAHFVLERTADYAGPRTLINSSRTYQINFGLQGAIDGIDGSWSFTGSHGNSLSTINFVGYMSLERYRSVARGPNFGVNFFEQGNQEAGGFSSGSGFCTSGLPFFKDISTLSEDCAHTLTVDMLNIANLNQDFAEFNFEGKLFDLPAGEVRFAAGYAWRSNDVHFYVDPLSSISSFTDLPAGSQPSDNTQGAFSVDELYGELLIPVVADLPGIQSLNLELGYRISDYDNLDDTIDTWKILGDWSINDSWRVRGGFQTANRAANLGELHQGSTQSFGFGPGDQCGNESLSAVSANPLASPDAAAVEALCRELMGPVGAEEFYDSGNSQPGIFGGRFGIAVGNPDLQSEEAETTTLGVVFQSQSSGSWLGPLSITADYYKIEISDMIVLEQVTSVYNECLGVDTNPTRSTTTNACERVLRNPATGGRGGTDVSFNNNGWVNTAGVDVQLNWGSDFSDIGWDIPGFFSVNFMTNILLDFDTRATPDSDVVDWVGSIGPDPSTGMNGGAYDFRTFTTFNYSLNDWSVNLRWRYLPEAVSLAQASNPNLNVPQHGAESTYHMFDLAGSWAVNDNFTVRAGIDNLLDEDPVITGEVDANGSNLYNSGKGTTTPGFYDTMGRRFYFGVKASF